MIDIETLALWPNAAIVSVACVPFDPVAGTVASDDAFYRRVDWEKQYRRGQSDVTVSWWAALARESARAELTAPNRVPLGQALAELRAFLGAAPVVWACPPAFDLVILSNAYAQEAGKGFPPIPYWTEHSPWGRRDERDARTALEMARVAAAGHAQLTADVDALRRRLEDEQSHHALEDARRQAEVVIACARIVRHAP